MVEQNRCYPDLPSQGKQQGMSFRIVSLSNALKDLKEEIRHYEQVRRKYNKAYGILTRMGVSTGTASIVLTSGGLGTSLTGFGAIVGIPLGVIGGLFGITSITCVAISKGLTNNLRKHEQTIAFGEWKARNHERYG